jgi:hypothetical protein
MQFHDGRRAEAASPWARLLRNDDRLTWTVAEAAKLLGISVEQARQVVQAVGLRVSVGGWQASNLRPSDYESVHGRPRRPGKWDLSSSGPMPGPAGPAPTGPLRPVE